MIGEVLCGNVGLQIKFRITTWYVYKHLAGGFVLSEKDVSLSKSRYTYENSTQILQYGRTDTIGHTL